MDLENPGPSAKHSTITEETARLINKWIMVMENSNKKSNCPPRAKQENYLQIIETFLSRTRASTNLPHLCFENIELNKCLKLKGGSKILNFDTEDEKKLF